MTRANLGLFMVYDTYMCGRYNNRLYGIVPGIDKVVWVARKVG